MRLPYPAKHLHASFPRVADAVKVDCPWPAFAGKKNVPHIVPLFVNRLAPAEVSFQFFRLLARDDPEPAAGSGRACAGVMRILLVLLVRGLMLLGVKCAEAQAAVKFGFGQHRMFPLDVLLDVLDSA